MGILNFPEIIISDVNIISENGGILQDIANYLYEYHGFKFDIDLYYNELNEAEVPNASTGSKVKDHFKKHWKKYAAGAAATGAVIGGSHLHNKIKMNNLHKAVKNVKPNKFDNILKDMDGFKP